MNEIVREVASSSLIGTIEGPAVEFRNVTRVYGSGGTRVVALDDVTVEFPSGSWTVVMGPSGSGKSTLLHIAGGLDKITSGWPSPVRW